jgi:DNA repair protein RadD
VTAPVLRPDQQRMVDETDAAFRAGHRGVLCVAPTAWGKGTVIAHWLARCATWGKRVLFVVHLAEIAFDVRARALAAGVPSVRVLSGDADEGDPSALVTIATWQTLVARRTELDVDIVIADECHRSKSRTFMDVLDRHRPARLLGFTATAQRGDGSGLGDVGFTAIVQGPQIAELVAAGHLAPCRVIAPDDYVEALAWEPADAWTMHAGRRPGIVFASSIPHSRSIAEALTRRGVRAMHVDSDTRDEQRAWAVEALERGELDALCCYRLFVEGVNVRRASVVMLASAFSHDGPYLQSIGRGRRVHPDKRECLVLDLRGNLHRREHPDFPRTYSLTGDGCRAALEALPYVRQCKCLAWVTRPVCEFCGTATESGRKPVRIVLAELREQAAAREAARLARQDAIPRTGAEYELFASIVRDLRKKGKAHRAAFVFRLKTGRLPRFRVEHVPDDAA